MKPAHEQVADAMQVLKDAGCRINTMMDSNMSIVFVVHVPLAKMDANVERAEAIS